MFIVVHQVHELWFKVLLHEFGNLQRWLSAGDGERASHTLRRSRTVLKAVVAQMEVMDTLTPAQFAAFRGFLGTASGAQSAQYREVEAVLGRRDRKVLRQYPEGAPERLRIEAAMGRPSVFDSFLHHLALRGYPIPTDVLYRDVTAPSQPSAEVQAVLAGVLAEDGLAAEICRGLTDLEQELREWRRRHSRMVQRMIGERAGTGGSTGASYLRATLAAPVFPDLHAVRSQP
jgi:tryptophan 2,3-dioxygenase